MNCSPREEGLAWVGNFDNENRICSLTRSMHHPQQVLSSNPHNCDVRSSLCPIAKDTSYPETSGSYTYSTDQSTALMWRLYTRLFSLGVLSTTAPCRRSNASLKIHLMQAWAVPTATYQSEHCSPEHLTRWHFVDHIWPNDMKPLSCVSQTSQGVSTASIWWIILCAFAHIVELELDPLCSVPAH